MQKRKSSIGSKVATIIFIIIVCLTLKIIYDFYKENYFGDFKKAEYIMKISEFKRDRNIKTSKNDSYRITSNTFNDAMFYKTVNVTPNTAYKVSCMIKTENVINEKKSSNGGACITISDTTEMSDSITGTNDWQKVEMLFNSKNRTTIDIGFRLGAYNDNSKGTAWFSDLKLEVGTKSTDTEWNMVCFVFENIDTNIDINGTSQNIKTNITDEEIYNTKRNIERFETSIKTLSNYNMTAKCDVINIKEPITEISYDKENGYFVSAANIKKLIEKYIEQKEYDYIFSVIKLGEILHEEKTSESTWIGLGSMDYKDIGFSNIRIPNDTNRYVYVYDSRINTFPEEVYVHEFLHTLERNLEENGIERPSLHDYEKYGYKTESLIGLKNWYQAYMTNTIKENDKYVGLDSRVYAMKPIQKSDFTYCMELEFANEPQNIIEEIRAVLKSFTKIKVNT